MRATIWLLSIGGVLGSAYGLYQLEHDVKMMERELAGVQEADRRDGEAIQVLQAEWSYLNRPERLQELAARHLDLAPPSLKQIAARPTVLAELPPAPARAPVDPTAPPGPEASAAAPSGSIPLPVAKPVAPRAVKPVPVLRPSPKLPSPPAIAVQAAYRPGTGEDIDDVQ